MTADKLPTKSAAPVGMSFGRAMRLVVFLLLMAALLFGAAGRVDWVMAWLYLTAYGVYSAIALAIMMRRSPDLIDERAEVPADAKAWDKKLTTFLIPFSLFVPMLVAGLDVRFGWSPPFSIGLQVAALVVYLLGSVFSFWASQVNRFYSRVVRIQKERGHVVVSDGPYRWVRHPGYVGVAVTLLVMPVMFGTLSVFIPNLLTLGVLVYRTAREDATLHEELEGYRAYAQRTRYRLLPGVW